MIRIRHKDRADVKNKELLLFLDNIFILAKIIIAVIHRVSEIRGALK